MAVDDILFRLRKEQVMVDGTKNMLKTLKGQKKTDPKTLNDVFIICLRLFIYLQFRPTIR